MAVGVDYNYEIKIDLNQYNQDFIARMNKLTLQDVILKVKN